MTNHPITPPALLVEQWLREWKTLGVRHADPVKSTSYVATEAAQWGADQELEACVDFVQYEADWNTAEKLRAARRPKPPSLKEQALAKTTAILNDPNRVLLIEVRETLELNRRALEQFDD